MTIPDDMKEAVAKMPVDMLRKIISRYNAMVSIQGWQKLPKAELIKKLDGDEVGREELGVVIRHIQGLGLTKRGGDPTKLGTGKKRGAREPQADPEQSAIGAQAPKPTAAEETPDRSFNKLVAMFKDPIDWRFFSARRASEAFMLKYPNGCSSSQFIELWEQLVEAQNEGRKKENVADGRDRNRMVPPKTMWKEIGEEFLEFLVKYVIEDLDYDTFQGAYLVGNVFGAPNLVYGRTREEVAALTWCAYITDAKGITRMPNGIYTLRKSDVAKPTPPRIADDETKDDEQSWVYQSTGKVFAYNKDIANDP